MDNIRPPLFAIIQTKGLTKPVIISNRGLCERYVSR